jgi:hypothetical protein
MEQATTFEVICGRGFDTTQYTEHFSKEKFAELIVKDCSSIVQTYMSRWPEDHELTKQIKKHFGFEL